MDIEWPFDIQTQPHWQMYNLIPDESKGSKAIKLYALHFDKSRRLVRSIYVPKEGAFTPPNTDNALNLLKTRKDYVDEVNMNITDDADKSLKKFKKKVSSYHQFLGEKNNDQFFLKCLMEIPMPYKLYEFGIVYLLLEQLAQDGLVHHRKPLKYFEISEYKGPIEEKQEDKRDVNVVYYNNKKEEGREYEKQLGKYGIRNGSDIYYKLYHPLADFLKYPLEKLEVNGIKYISFRNECIVIPIFDIYLRDNMKDKTIYRGYGGIQGAYVIYIMKEEKKEEIKTNIEDHLIPNIPQISDAIYRANLFQVSLLQTSKQKHTSEETRETIIEKPKYDFIDYFLRMIIHVQDWENIWVFKTQNENERNRRSMIKYYTRKSPEDGDFTYEWVDVLDTDDHEKSQGNIKEKELENKKGYFTFNITDVAYLLLDSEEQQRILEGEYVIHCEYSTLSFLPDNSSAEVNNEYKKYNECMKLRFLHMFQLAINMWEKQKLQQSLQKTRDSAHQASHTLGHPLTKLDKELKKKMRYYLTISKKYVLSIFPRTTKDEIRSIDAFLKHINDEKKTTRAHPEMHKKELDIDEGLMMINRTLVECWNFFHYLQQRLEYLTVSGTDEKLDIDNLRTESWKEIYRYYKTQTILSKYLTVNSPSDKAGFCPRVKLTFCDGYTEHIFTFHGSFQAFYVILENYIRNVAKHDEPEGDIHCYIRTEKKEGRLCISLYDNTIKGVRPKKIYEGFVIWKEGCSRGAREVRNAAELLLSPDQASFSTSLVLVSEGGEETVEIDFDGYGRARVKGREIPKWAKNEVNKNRTLKAKDTNGNKKKHRLSFMYKFDMQLWPQKLLIVVGGQAKIFFIKDSIWVIDHNKLNKLRNKLGELGFFTKTIYYNCDSEKKNPRREHRIKVTSKNKLQKELKNDKHTESTIKFILQSLLTQ